MASLVNAEITEIRQAPAGLSGSAIMPLGVGLGLIGLAGAAGTVMGEMNRFWHAYLLGVMFVTSLGVGGLFFVIGHHLTGGRWATPVRRLAELTASTLTTSFVLFIPIILMVLSGNSELYPWVDRQLVMSDPILSAKAIYLEPTWFAIRACVYFGLWIWMARTMLGMSVRQDSDQPLKQAHRMQWWSGPMTLLYALSMNFAAFDWMMSLEPHWFSTMFGVYFFTGSFEGFLAATIVLAVYLHDRGILNQSITTEQYHDLAKLMFAFIVFWGYIAFSQYMLIWYANLPEETVWFRYRLENGWEYNSLALLVMHFIIPFAVLITQWAKKTRPLLAIMGVWFLVMHWFDLHWLIMPVHHEKYAVIHLLDITTWLGLFGILIGLFMYRMSRHSMLPEGDPKLKKSMTYG